MKRSVLLCAVLVLAASGTSYADLFTASSGSLSASAEFTILGGNLTITLTNRSTQTTGWTNGQLLAALFFDIAGDPSLTFGSAVVAPGGGVVTSSNLPLSSPASIMAPPSGSLVGGWGFATIEGGLSDVTQRYGLGTSGFSGIWNGQLVGGGGRDSKPGNYALVGDLFEGGNNGLDSPLINNAAVFTLGGLGADAIVRNVRFQYGSDFPGQGLAGEFATPSDPPDSSIVTPEPASMLLLGTGLLGCSAFLRRRKQ